MADYSLIPFGLRQSDQQFVDVSEVQRGSKCGCICPSCSTPLIARQGEVNVWHFAHLSKNVSHETKRKCEYSFWVSVTLMAKQVITKAKHINLPSLKMYLNDAREVVITESHKVTIDKVELEKSKNNIYADAVITVGKYFILVIFTAPHKQLHFDPSEANKSNNSGVLEISLVKAYMWFFGTQKKGKYTQIIENNILFSQEDKRWLYHPRSKIIEEKNNVELYLNKPSDNSASYIKRESQKYKCLACEAQWHGDHICPKCNTHLYSIKATEI
ncbi:MAG: competence protein CoiA family protein [Candidatus Thiodiazotropha sp.]